MLSSIVDSSQNKSLGKRFKEWAGKRIVAFGTQLSTPQGSVPIQPSLMRNFTLHGILNHYLGFQVPHPGLPLDKDSLLKFVVNNPAFQVKLKKNPVDPTARTKVSQYTNQHVVIQLRCL